MIDYDNSYHNCVQQYMHRRNLDHVYCVRVRAYLGLGTCSNWHHRVSKISSYVVNLYTYMYLGRLP